MALNQIQHNLLSLLQNALMNSPDNTFVYHLDDLGFPPSVFYVWITVDGSDITSKNLSDWDFGWSRRDLITLEDEGFIIKIDEWENPDDDFYDMEVTYRLKLA